MRCVIGVSLHTVPCQILARVPLALICKDLQGMGLGTGCRLPALPTAQLWKGTSCTPVTRSLVDLHSPWEPFSAWAVYSLSSHRKHSVRQENWKDVQSQRQQPASHSCLTEPCHTTSSTEPAHHLPLPGALLVSLRAPDGDCEGRAHLEVFEAQLAAEELMLLPHVLLQVPEEAERWQFRALWALMLQQLPRRHQEPTAHHRHSALPSGASTGTSLQPLAPCL